MWTLWVNRDPVKLKQRPAVIIAAGLFLLGASQKVIVGLIGGGDSRSQYVGSVNQELIFSSKGM